MTVELNQLEDRLLQVAELMGQMLARVPKCMTPAELARVERRVVSMIKLADSAAVRDVLGAEAWRAGWAADALHGVLDIVDDARYRAVTQDDMTHMLDAVREARAALRGATPGGGDDNA